MKLVSFNRMVAHGIELLTAGSDHADVLLHEERYSLGGISIEELHRLVYAQILSSHPLTCQVSSDHLTMNPIKEVAWFTRTV